MNTTLKLEDFHFDLPPELIASQPVEPRSACRLMDVSAACRGRIFDELPQLLVPGDLLVINDSKVMRARLWGHKATGGAIEILIERVQTDTQALAHVRSSKSPKPGSLLWVGETAIEVVGRQADLFELALVDSDWDSLMANAGHMPLPPYIQRDAVPSDECDYQTVYATHTGSVAAPTAGLHFDAPLFAQLAARGVEIGRLTLHVGAGTFAPIRTSDITAHQMHSERVQVSDTLCEQIRATHAAGRRVIAVGTTCVRALETAAKSGDIAPYAGETDIFIYPGFRFNCVDGLITNFHLPGSSLILLVAAFAGAEVIKSAYQQAIGEGYRFYSYGDAMLLAPADSAR